MSAATVLQAWCWPSAPPERLAVLRIVTGAWVAGYLLVRLPAFLALAHPDAGAFDPVGVLAALPDPVPAPWVTAAVVVTLALAVAYTLGLWFAVTGPAFTVALLALFTYRSSWGQILWFETLVMLHVLIVGLSPSADALAVGRRPAAATASPGYGGPVRLAATVTVTVYFLSGVAKLRLAGPAWVSSDNLRNHIAYSAARLDILGGTPSPFAPWLVSHSFVLLPMAVATIVLELGAPLALLGGWLRTSWVAGVWMLHVGIAVSLLVVWGYPLWGVAFAPLFALERIPQWLRARRSRRGRRGAIRTVLPSGAR